MTEITSPASPASPAWTDRTRSDGLTIAPMERRAPTGPTRWMIRPTDGGIPLSYCPCCGAYFTSAETARLVADRCYPLPEPPPPDTA